jgi:hypothetical protein
MIFLKIKNISILTKDEGRTEETREKIRKEGETKIRTEETI